MFLEVFFSFLLLCVQFDECCCSSRKLNLAAEQVKTDQWIVHLHPSITHNNFELALERFYTEKERYLPKVSPYNGTRPLIKRRLKRLIHAAVVHGTGISDLLRIEGVTRVVPDTIKKILRTSSSNVHFTTETFTVPWGIDRIDQESLPLDGIYQPEYTGAGTDIYIVDTGIDTTHQEFQQEIGFPIRTVQNILDVYASLPSKKTNPGPNIDGEGHGTHVAGTAGGRSVGVSPGANLFGLRVLDDEGSGETSGIIEALEYILERQMATGRPSVVSMSLGGPCETDDCSQDTLVMAVESLILQGIPVSVASGNEGCNACSGSPNSAPNAIVSGASDNQDAVTYFSNFGQCNDLYAPGLEIISACATVICNSIQNYVAFSGTSMACPHTTGVIAQLQQKFTNIQAERVPISLMCIAARSQLGFPAIDNISKNLLLNIPRLIGDSSTCDLGRGCEQDCTGNGVCLPIHKSASAELCHCDTGFYGTTCNLNADPICSAPGAAFLSVNMYDTYGDGWTFSNYAITDLVTGNIVNNIYDSLCYGDSGSNDVCLPEGCYLFEVTSGYIPQEVLWNFCGTSGGAPYTGYICISQGECELACPYGTLLNLILSDASSSGWKGAYYSLYDEQGKRILGGTTTDDGTVHQACLAVGCFYLMYDIPGSHPEDISIKVCDEVMYYRDIAKICIDEAMTCKVTLLPEKIDGMCSSEDSLFSIMMFDGAGVGWNNVSINVSNEHGVVYNSDNMARGFASSDSVCLPDGCYDFTVEGVDLGKKDFFWFACGFKGPVPFESKQLCIEKAYDLCYGLTPCPFMKSYAKHSDGNLFMISHVYDEAVDGGDSYYYDDYGYGGGLDAYKRRALLEDDIFVVDTIENIHSVHNLCGLRDSCYRLDVGGGKYTGFDRSSFSLCGLTTTFPISANVCFGANGTICEIVDVIHPICQAGAVAHKFIKFDTWGDGWNNGHYLIKKDSHTIYSGTLANGQAGVDDICLVEGSCYTLTIPESTDSDEILWQLCGMLGGAPVRNAEFCVTSLGCAFRTDDDAYNSVTDDDFPQIFRPTLRPTIFERTREPTNAPLYQGVPSTPVATSAYVYMTNFTLLLSVEDSGAILQDSDISFVGYASKYLLVNQGIDVWKISTKKIAQEKEVNTAGVHFAGGGAMDVFCFTSIISPTIMSTSKMEDIFLSAIDAGHFQKLLDVALQASGSTIIQSVQSVVRVVICPNIEVVKLSEGDPTSDDTYDNIWPKPKISENKVLLTADVTAVLVILIFFSGLAVGLLFSVYFGKTCRSLSVSTSLSSSVHGLKTRRSFFRTHGKYQNLMDSSIHNPMDYDSSQNSERRVDEVEMGALAHEIIRVSAASGKVGLSEEDESGVITVELSHIYDELPMSVIKVQNNG